MVNGTQPASAVHMWAPDQFAHRPASPTSQSGSESGLVGELKRTLDWAETVEAVIALMRSAETQQSLAQLAPAWRDEVRAYAKDRLVALGWTPKQAA